MSRRGRKAFAVVEWISIILTLGLFVVVVVGFAHAAGERVDAQRDWEAQLLEREERVVECINAGGLPQYTTDRYGRVVSYLGCVTP